MSKISGSCLCGAIHYSSPAEPAMVALCHCRHCQQQSGAAFSVNVAIPVGTIQITSGTPATFEDRGTSGLAVLRHFCASCGSPIYTHAVAMPTLDFVKAGTLDDASWVMPNLNIWCDSAQPWVPHPEAAAKFAQNPPLA